MNEIAGTMAVFLLLLGLCFLVAWAHELADEERATASPERIERAAGGKA